MLRRPVEFTLAALVGVMDHVRRPALRERHVERLEHELRAQVRRHRPADDAAAPRVEHDSEVEEAGPRRDVGDVRDPEPIRPGGREVAIHEIGCGPCLAIAESRVGTLAPAHAGQAQRAHEPGDPLAADVHAERRQLRVDPTLAVGAARPRVDDADLFHERRIGRGARRRRADGPRVVPAGGDAQHAALRGDRMHGLVAPHELESFGGIEPVSRANQAAAFFKISRSSRRTLFSRRSRRSSSRSSVVRPSWR